MGENRNEAKTMVSKACFRNFLQGVTVLEALHNQGTVLLESFAQEVDYFKRKPLSETSPIVAKVLEQNQTKRALKYMENECKHIHTSTQNVQKIDRIVKSLHDYITKVEEVHQNINEHMDSITEVQILDLNGALPATLQISPQDDSEPAENESSLTEQHDSSPELGNDGGFSAQRKELSCMDYFSMATAIAGMVEKDIEMQLLILNDVALDMNEEELQTYVTMWKLRPYINETVVHEAMAWL